MLSSGQNNSYHQPSSGGGTKINQSGYINSSFIEKVNCEWKRTWEGNGSNFVRDMVIDSSDNIYVTGETGPRGDIFLLKYNSSGTLLWSRIWGSLDERDFGTKVALDTNDYIYVGGIINWSEDDAIIVLKYSPQGDLIWTETTYGDSCSGLVVDSHDNIIITGTYLHGKYLRLLKFNSDGNLIWSKSYSADTYYYYGIWGMEITSQDKICMLATMNSSHYLLYLDTDGVIQHNTTVVDGRVFYFTIDNMDMIYITVEYQTMWYVLKYNTTSFSYMWNITLTTLPTYYDFYKITTDAQCNIYVAGKSYLLMKFDSQGKHCWNFTEVESNDKFEARKISCDSNNNIYCIYNVDSEIYEEEVGIIKYDNSDHTIHYLKTPKYLPKKLHMLLIGASNYPGSSYDLSWADEDVRDLARFLKSEYNVPLEYIHYIRDSVATKTAILNSLENIRTEIDEEEECLIYYSGHGGGDAIYPYDSIYYDEYNDLYSFLSWNEVTTEEFKEELDAINCSKKYVVIDACESGDFIYPRWLVENCLYILSCKGDEFSIETRDLGNGVFTYYFMESFRHADDINGDGFISLEEQYLYVEGKVSSYARQYDCSQNPLLRDDLLGESFIGPVLEAVEYNKTKYTISYQFNLHGCGQVYDIYFKVNGNSESIIMDVNKTSISKYGFGKGSGILHFDTGQTIKSIELIAELKGFDFITLSDIYYFPTKSQAISFSPIWMISMWIFFIIICKTIILVKKKLAIN